MATDANQRIAYKNAKGWLFYDDDSNGAHAAPHFATLTGTPAISNGHFVVI